MDGFGNSQAFAVSELQLVPAQAGDAELELVDGELVTSAVAAASDIRPSPSPPPAVPGLQERNLFGEAERIAARDHPDAAVVLHNLGGLAHAAGTPADGEAPAREALRIHQATLGPNHPAAAADGAALAGILIAIGHDEEATKLLEHSLEVFERCYGPRDLEVATTLGSLGVIDARQGDLQRAETRLRTALSIKEQHLGADHLELVPTLGTLGVICRRQGRFAEARESYHRGLELLEGRGAPDHPQIAALRSNLHRLDSWAAPERCPDQFA